MKALLMFVAMFLTAGQAFAFVEPNTRYECRDGRRLHINHLINVETGEFGMDFYYEADGDAYYEGSIVRTSLSNADVYHHEGDKVGYIRAAGFNRIVLEVSRANTTCFKR